MYVLLNVDSAAARELIFCLFFCKVNMVADNSGSVLETVPKKC